MASVTQWRKRRQQQGFMRVEVQARKTDVALVQKVAEALADPTRGDQTRAILRQCIVTPGAGGLKALLSAAPLEGIELERQRDVGRDVTL